VLSPVYHELHFESGDVLTLKKGANDMGNEWLAALRQWRYPFTNDEVIQIIEWCGSHTPQLELVHSWGMYAHGTLRINDGAYEAVNPLVDLPFFKKAHVIELGKMLRLISR
jgi:hypothetical protein